MNARAEVQQRIADLLVDRCPDHGCVEPAWSACHCELIDVVLLLVIALCAGTADLAEDVANELFGAYDTEQGNGAMAVAARLRARADQMGQQ